MKARLDPAILITLAIFGLVGLCFCLGAIWTAWEKHQIITTWPRANAQVVQSRVDLYKPTVYQAEIQVRYQIQGKTYSPILKSEETSSIYGLMQALVDLYPVGTTHSLPYSPIAPDKPVLDAGYHLRFFFLPLLLAVIGLILSMIALVLWIWPYLPPKTPAKGAYRSRKYLPLWLGGGFAGIGLFMLAMVAVWAYNQAQSLQWPELKAEIVSSKVLSYYQRSSTRYFAPALDLRYSVAGKTYHRPICPESGLSEAEVADKMASEYAINQPLSLRYNPNNPYEIELYHAPFTFGWILGGIGAGFLFLGSVIGLVFGKVFRSR